MPSIDGVELVDHVKSLGVILHQGLSCDLHVSATLKQCSQRIYLLRLLRSQGLSADLLLLLLLYAVTHAPFHAPVLRPTSWPNARDRRDREVN